MDQAWTGHAGETVLITWAATARARRHCRRRQGRKSKSQSLVRLWESLTFG